MTDAKAFLRQIEVFDTHINNKLEEVAHLKDLATKITSSMKPDAGSGSGNSGHDKIGDAVAKIVDLEREINKDIDAYIERKRKVSEIIKRVKDPDQLQVLYKRYIQYEHWEEIACEMHMTYRNVCYIHGRALQAVTELLKDGADNG